MELNDQTQSLSLAKRLGDISHLSPLLRRVRQLSGIKDGRLPAWLLRCAIMRGATHYRRVFDADIPSDNPLLSREELGVALCLAHHNFDPTLIRAAAQILSSPDTHIPTLVRLALMERCEPVLLHIAAAAARIDPDIEPWRTLNATLPRRHQVRLDALPHWSRFVLQTGYTSKGRGQHIQWLMCHE